MVTNLQEKFLTDEKGNRPLNIDIHDDLLQLHHRAFDILWVALPCFSTFLHRLLKKNHLYLDISELLYWL
ncbi:MAG: hypothetical protein DCF12_10960 [Snowella sp.]|nr:MAG: hypothetical protein DCF12_10960 [Snowella sp.]